MNIATLMHVHIFFLVVTCKVVSYLIYFIVNVGYDM